MTAPVLLTVPEACDYLRVTRSWLYDAVERRRIEVVRVGGRLRFTEAALAAYVELNTTPARPLAPLRHIGRRM